jgi:flagellar hook-basal body complex protein FliE
MATFQPDRPTTDLGAATFVQQGVKDVGRESLANLLATAGKAAWEFKVAGDISQTQEQATQAITDFTNQVSNANNEVLDAQSQFIAASEDVQWGASSYSPTADEVKALEDAKTNLARVKTARANNVITETEMRARVSDITRKGISLMPGRSREFIQASNEALGTHSGNIKLEADRQTVLLED